MDALEPGPDDPFAELLPEVCVGPARSAPCDPHALPRATEMMTASPVLIFGTNGNSIVQATVRQSIRARTRVQCLRHGSCGSPSPSTTRTQTLRATPCPQWVASLHFSSSAVPEVTLRRAEDSRWRIPDWDYAFRTMRGGHAMEVADAATLQWDPCSMGDPGRRARPDLSQLPGAPEPNAGPLQTGGSATARTQCCRLTEGTDFFGRGRPSSSPSSVAAASARRVR